MGPIVIVGGFLSYPQTYYEMRRVIADQTGQPVSVTGIPGHEWLLATSQIGWARLLMDLDLAVLSALQDSPGRKITLIGHSAGGVLARLYLGTKPFLGRRYRGLEKVDRLITLGSPHYNRGNWRRGGSMAHYVEESYPGAYFQPQVRYTSVAGKSTLGDRSGGRRQRWAFAQYQDLCGQGGVWGDGLVPLESALLHGAEQIILEHVSHHTIFGRPWYGSPLAIQGWWRE
jgi:pimeloyl-ACP methyl ester carboxylesterase